MSFWLYSITRFQVDHFYNPYDFPKYKKGMDKMDNELGVNSQQSRDSSVNYVAKITVTNNLENKLHLITKVHVVSNNINNAKALF